MEQNINSTVRPDRIISFRGNIFPGEEHLELQLEKLDLGPCIVDAASGSQVIIALGPWCGGRIEQRIDLALLNIDTEDLRRF